MLSYLHKNKEEGDTRIVLKVNVIAIHYVMREQKCRRTRYMIDRTFYIYDISNESIAGSKLLSKVYTYL